MATQQIFVPWDGSTLSNFLQWSNNTTGMSYALAQLGFISLGQAVTSYNGATTPGQYSWSVSTAVANYFNGKAGSTIYIGGNTASGLSGSAIGTFTIVSATTTTLLTSNTYGSSQSAGGWASLDAGVVNWNNVASALSTYTSATGQIPIRVGRPTTINNGVPIAAYNSGTAYTGMANSTVSGNVSVVTYSGISWFCVTSGTGNTPGANTDWSPYIYEIWTCSDTLASTMPWYIKIVYSINSTTYYSPALNISIGTSFNGSGFVAGNVFNTNASSSEIWTGESVAGVTTPVEWDFCGNGQGGVGNLSWILGRGAINTNSSTVQPHVLSIDRMKANNGTDLGGFIFIATHQQATPECQVLFNNSIGGFIPATPTYAPMIYWAQLTGSYGGQTPIFPALPVVGYIANPQLGVMGGGLNDVGEGSVVSCVMYGASHNFLGTKASHSCYLTPGTTNWGVYIRWE